MTQEEIQKHHDLCEETKKRFQEAGVRGPWDTEPHRVEWRYAGLACLAQRSYSMLNWCGYVGVPPGHPFYGKKYTDEGPYDLGVHGGLTYSAKCKGFICHVPERGEDDVWWFGFDCGHAGDQIPGLDFSAKACDLPMRNWARYRDLDYVKGEVQGLAEQLATAWVLDAAQKSPEAVLEVVTKT
jgi:hypothetical protein